MFLVLARAVRFCYCLREHEAKPLLQALVQLMQRQSIAYRYVGTQRKGVVTE